MNEKQAVAALKKINKVLQVANPTIGQAMAAFHILRAQFRRKEDGEAEMPLSEVAARLESAGQRMVDNADAWFAAHPDYDPATGNPRK